MATSYESRLGTAPEEAVKAPCVVAATSNITLSGEQTIDGVSVEAGDRVLVAGQTDKSENGIYVAATSAWSRATDWNDAQDVVNGQLVSTPNAIYEASFNGAFDPGTTEVTFTDITVTSVNNTSLYELGTTAAAASHGGIITGHVIEFNYLDSNRTYGSGRQVAYTGTTTVGKAGNWPDADGYYYDADGKQFYPLPLQETVTRYDLGTDAAAASHPGISEGHVIEVNFRDNNRVNGSGHRASYTGTTDAGEAGNWFGDASDEFAYDADGKQFKLIKRRYVVDNIKALIEDGNKMVGAFVSVRAFYSDTENGGGEFYWDADRAKSDANGIWIIDPDNVGTLSDTALGTYFDQQGGGAGTGCWVRTNINDNYHHSWAGVDTSKTASENDKGHAALFSALDGVSGTLHLISGTVAIDDEVRFPNSINVQGNQTVFDAEGSTGSFTHGATVYTEGPDYVQIEELNGNVSEGDTTITLASTPSISAGEWVLLYNPTDGSHHPDRINARRGEIHRVASIATNTLTLEGALYADYTVAEVDVFKLTESNIFHRDYKAIAPGIADSDLVEAITFDRIIGLDVHNLDGRGSTDKGIELVNCVNVTGSLRGTQRIADSQTTDYGLMIASCQHVLINGQFVGRRHGVNLGGVSTAQETAGSKSWVNRDVYVSGTAINLVDNRHAAAIKTMSEYCTVDLHVRGGQGVVFCGNHNTVIIRGGTLSGGQVVTGSQLTGFDHVIDIVGKVFANGNETARGLIDIGGNDLTTLNSDTNDGGTLSVRRVSVDAPNCAVQVIRVKNRGYTGDAFRMHIGDVDVSAPNCTELVRVETNSGDDMESIRFSGVISEDTGVFIANTLPAATKVSGLRQAGTTSWTTTTSTEQVNNTVTFPKQFPRAPVVTIGPDFFRSAIGDRVLATAESVARDDFVARLSTADEANFAGASTINGMWQAVLDEF